MQDEYSDPPKINPLTLRIAWWNTHLTPPRGPALDRSEQGLVLEVIKKLLEVSDILFLGEVSSLDLRSLSDYCAGTPFVVKDMTTASGRLKFNIGLIYREDILSFIGNEFKIAKIGGNNYKITCRTDFMLGSDYFSFLVSHWPSRLLARGDSEIRGHYGSALRSEVDMLQAQGIKYIVTLGDFNDEPYDHSMTTYLRGCRDVAFVKRNPDLLYNPFWKRIACSRGYVRGPHSGELTGTYFHAADTLHRWRVFDQMLFCASFVGLSEWHLNEDNTGVYRSDALVHAVESRLSKLDHLPIVAQLTKEDPHGGL